MAMLDTVRPLLGRDGSVSAYQDKLIVRGTAAQIEQVQSLINELDRPASVADRGAAGRQAIHLDTRHRLRRGHRERAPGPGPARRQRAAGLR